MQSKYHIAAAAYKQIRSMTRIQQSMLEKQSDPSIDTSLYALDNLLCIKDNSSEEKTNAIEEEIQWNQGDPFRYREFNDHAVYKFEKYVDNDPSLAFGTTEAGSLWIFRLELMEKA